MMRRRAIVARAGTVRPTRRPGVFSLVGKLVSTGFRVHVTSERVLGERVVLMLVGATAGLILSDGVRAAGAAMILGAAGWRLPEVRAAKAAEVRRRKIVASLPDALDVMSACARAGSSVAQAFGFAAERDAGPLGRAMRDAVDALDHGLSRDHAYELLCAGADVPEVRTVTATLRRAERLGTSLADTLADLAREMREQRRAVAEEHARGTPVRILFPIVVCFLPAFGLLTVAPVLIVALRSFRGA